MTGLVMNEGYSVGRAEKKASQTGQQEGQVCRPMFPSDVLLRTIIDDRERSIQERLRMRRQIGPRQPAIRWRSDSRGLARHDRGQDL